MGKRRLEFLDSLRGVAALMVLYLHVSRDSIVSLGLRHGWEYAVMYACTFIADFGKIGVVLFFAISGFIIPVSFGSSRRPALMFVISRFFRLYPAYWASLILGVIVLFAWQSKPIPWAAVAANTTMLQTAFGEPDVLGVYWTLFIEWIFYAFCVAAFLAGKLGKTKFSFNAAIACLALTLITAAVRYQTHRKLPVALAAALSIMIWASLWRNYLIEGDLLAKRLAYVYAGIFTAVFPGIAILAYNFDTGFDETWYRYTVSYLIGISMFLFFTGVWRLRSRTLTWLGSVSYSLYLLHSVVISALEHVQRGRLPLGSAHLLFLEAAGISLLAAHLSYRVLEKPAIKLGQLVRSRMQELARSPRSTASTADAAAI